jgi:hypothetical protein
MKKKREEIKKGENRNRELYSIGQFETANFQVLDNSRSQGPPSFTNEQANNSILLNCYNNSVKKNEKKKEEEIKKGENRNRELYSIRPIRDG